MVTSMQRRGFVRRSRQRGLTLIEITIALAIAALAVSVGVISINALTDANLKSSALSLAGAIKFNYDRAIMEKRTQRLGLDLDRQVWWIEFTEDPYALAQERMRGEEGDKRSLEGDGEEQLEELDSFFSNDDDDAEVKRVMEGGKAASFVPDEAGGKPRPLPGDVRFSKVWTGHQEESFTSGVAYIHFFRGGWTEPAQIELSDGTEYVTLKVFPLTGRVRTYDKQLEDPSIQEYDGREEGDE
ncbi:MAG: prepilin-type N-terminal cleavage/methylation domain-containing protein [Deltaproteobacteria bacterium]|jgi:general secretion pathway protein H